MLGCTVKTFETIEGREIRLLPDSVIEAYAINDNQSLVLDLIGRKVILNDPFETIQYYLMYASDKEWIYTTGICGKTVMLDPLHIKSILPVNKTQCKIVFDNNKKLYAEINGDDLKSRLKNKDEVSENESIS